MRLAALLVAGLLACPLPLRAAVVHMTSFDVVDDGTTTAAETLPSDWANTSTDDGDLYPIATVNYGATYGGTDTSTRSLFVGPGSGQTAYLSLGTDRTLSSTIVYAGFTLRYTALPSVERSIFQFREGSNTGCDYRLQTDGTIKAYYESSLQGTTVDKLWASSCTTPYQWVGCAVNADCPSGATCGGAQYWAELEVRQISAPGTTNRASCDLWWHGRQEWTSAYDSTLTQTPAAVTNVRVGAPGTEASAMTLYVDNLVIGTETSVGHGWVGFLTPDANGTTVGTFTDEGCTSNLDWQCENDWDAGGVLGTGTSDTLWASKARVASLAFEAPTTAELDGLTIPAVEWAVVARTSGTSGSGTMSVESTLATCPSATCAYLTTVASNFPYANTTPILLARTVETGAPDGAWSATALGDAELTVETPITPAGSGRIRLSAMGLMYYAEKPALEETAVLQDHDEGTDDGEITVTLVGDSLATGTAAATCSNDSATSCNQDSFCSWDSNENGLYEDLPTGGCTTDAECRTCISKRSTTPRGAGYPCTAAAQCPQSVGNPVGALATCDVANGACNDNDAIPCTTDADCTGWGASCATTATCQDACPGVGGSCPSASARGSWAKTIVGKINADNIIVCGLGGERIYTLVEGRFALALQGDVAASCEAVKGTLTADPDYVVVLEGANDLFDWAFPAPTCGEPTTLLGLSFGNGQLASGGICRDNCTAAQRDILCDADADCSGISSSSKCVGASNVNETSANGYACGTSALANGVFHTCSIEQLADSADEVTLLGGCNTSSDCRASTTCSINDATQRKMGYCSCDATSDCSAGFSCVGSQCRRNCTTDANCTTTTRTGACMDQGGGVKVCGGRCTCPCNARSCTTNADCATGTDITAGAWFTWTPGGTCTAGKCTQCGPETCATAGYPDAYAHTMATLSADKYADIIDELARQIAALPDPTADGLPVLIVVEHPTYPFNNHTCTEVPLYADPGYLRGGVARALQRGHHVVTGMRELTDGYRMADPTWGSIGPTPRVWLPSGTDTGLFSDYVHFSVVGGGIISDRIAAYMNTLGSCAVGTGAEAVAQRYCYDYTTATYASTGCTASDTCAARELCALRACTSNSDCPAAGDACRVE